MNTLKNTSIEYNVHIMLKIFAYSFMQKVGKYSFYSRVPDCHTQGGIGRSLEKKSWGGADHSVKSTCPTPQ